MSTRAIVSDMSSDVIARTPAGLALAQLLDALDPELLDPSAQLDYIEACERQQAWWHARQNRAISAFVGNNPRNTVYHVQGDEMQLIDVRQSELGAALHWSEAVAGARISTARMVARELPATAAASACGTLPALRVRAIAEAAEQLVAPLDEVISHARVARVDSEQIDELLILRATLLQQFETCVVEYATEHTLARTRDRLRATLHRLDPDGAAMRRRRAIQERTCVTLRHDDDGLSTITATLPSEHAVVCWQAIDGIARTGDRRESLGLRRAKALTSLLCREDAGRTSNTPDKAHSHIGRAGSVAAGVAHGDHDRRAIAPDPITSNPATRHNVSLDLVMDLGTYLRLNEDSAAIVGAGPIPAAAARELLDDAAHVTLRRVISDPRTGARLDTGVKRYLLTDAERELIRRRDTRCRFKDCGQPAHRCECDHALAYADGGSTNTANLGLACKRHHQCKTHGGWSITESQPDGSCTWLSPLGRSHAHAALPVLPWLVSDLAAAGVDAETLARFTAADSATTQLQALRMGLHTAYSAHSRAWATEGDVERGFEHAIPALEEAELQVLDQQQLPAFAVAARHGEVAALLHTRLTRHAHRTHQSHRYPAGLLHDDGRLDVCPF